MRNRVRQLREERGLSQGQLAQAMGVSRQTINSIETERFSPSLPLAIMLSRFFRKPVEEVFQGKGKEVRRSRTQGEAVTHREPT